MPQAKKLILVISKKVSRKKLIFTKNIDFPDIYKHYRNFFKIIILATARATFPAVGVKTEKLIEFR